MNQIQLVSQLSKYIKNAKSENKSIGFVPTMGYLHEGHESLINKSKKYSTAIIVDKVGILPELYNYTKIAYVGGGFGKGVHNTFEPLVYNNTVCYGPNIDLLNEAKEMNESNCGFIVNNYSDISKIVNYHFVQKLHTNKDLLSREQIKDKIKLFIRSKNQSANKIYETIHNNI